MLTLAAADTIAGVASSASEVTCTLFLMELNGTTEVYTKDQQQLAAAAATIYTVPGSTTAFVRSIHVVNTDATNGNTFQLFVGGTAAANAITPVISLPPGGMAVYEDQLGWQVLDAVGDIRVRDAWGFTMQGDRAATYLKVPIACAGTEALSTGIRADSLCMVVPAGTYVVNYWLVYESSLAATGISLGCNFTGGSSVYEGWMQFASTGTSASTGAASMVASGATGQMSESFGFRAKSTTAPNMGPTVSVDAAGAAMLARITATLVATTAGRLELWFASDTANANVTLRPGSALIVHRVN